MACNTQKSRLLRAVVARAPGECCDCISQGIPVYGRAGAPVKCLRHQVTKLSRIHRPHLNMAVDIKPHKGAALRVVEKRKLIRKFDEASCR